MYFNYYRYDYMLTTRVEFLLKGRIIYFLNNDIIDKLIQLVISKLIPIISNVHENSICQVLTFVFLDRIVLF